MSQSKSVSQLRRRQRKDAKKGRATVTKNVASITRVFREDAAAPTVDNTPVQSSRAIKEACRVVTTTNITLSGTQTIDGVALAVGNRVLVNAQTTASQNGIYLVVDATYGGGTWKRADDFDEDAEIASGIIVPVSEGTTYANSLWFLTTNDPIVLGTTSISFTNITGTGAAGYTDEQAQDAVGAMVNATLVYVDAPASLGRAALTGDVTAAAGSNVTTIEDNVVTFAKLQDAGGPNRIIGRYSGGAGDYQEAAVGGGLHFDASQLIRSALTGDVTASAGSGNLTIVNDVVTYAKMQNVSAASKLLGRGSAGGAGDVEEISLGTGLSMSGATLDAAGSQTIRKSTVTVGSISSSTTETDLISITSLANSWRDNTYYRITFLLSTGVQSGSTTLQFQLRLHYGASSVIISDESVNGAPASNDKSLHTILVARSESNVIFGGFGESSLNAVANTHWRGTADLHKVISSAAFTSDTTLKITGQYTITGVAISSSTFYTPSAVEVVNFGGVNA